MPQEQVKWKCSLRQRWFNVERSNEQNVHVLLSLLQERRIRMRIHRKRTLQRLTFYVCPGGPCQRKIKLNLFWWGLVTANVFLLRLGQNKNSNATLWARNRGIRLSLCHTAGSKSSCSHLPAECKLLEIGRGFLVGSHVIKRIATMGLPATCLPHSKRGMWWIVCEVFQDRNWLPAKLATGQHAEDAIL